MIASIVEEIFELYEQKGHLEYGENVSQLQHAIQAAELAFSTGHDDATVLAAFLHDIGHLLDETGELSMGDFGTVRHESIGANFLRKKGFSEKIARLVEGHVEAKRYMTFKFPEYYDRLSEASKKTLEYQGGKMNNFEARDFESNYLFEDCLRLRIWDDEAKKTGAQTGDLQWLKEIMYRHLDAQPIEID
ncbi:MAG TPA: HDIG domain-containing protein [Saprospiraceae bacterium]|nr:HDIG domain-containing protein [Saprospiraceae bacterium]